MVVIRREDMVQSANVMLTNSGLATIADADEAASALRSISSVAEAGEGPLSGDEFVAIADHYATARAECRRVFKALPREQQDEAKACLGS